MSPSGVDTTHQEKILEQIAENDYYIFDLEQEVRPLRPHLRFEEQHAV